PNVSTEQPQEPSSEAPVAIALTPDEQKSIGVETMEVKRQTVRKEIVAPGKVAEPETGIGTISARISGRIEKLFLNVTGESVTRGQADGFLYSPAVRASADEYLHARKNLDRLNASKSLLAVAR